MHNGTLNTKATSEMSYKRVSADIPQYLTVEMLVNGQVDRVRPILTPRIEPARLNKFLNSLGKMTVQGSDEFLEGHVSSDKKRR